MFTGEATLGVDLREYSVTHQHRVRTTDETWRDARTRVGRIFKSTSQGSNALRTRVRPGDFPLLSQCHESGRFDKVINNNTILTLIPKFITEI